MRNAICYSQAGKLQQRLVEAAGIKLLTRSRQSFFLHTSRGWGCLVGGTVSLL